MPPDELSKKPPPFGTTDHEILRARARALAQRRAATTDIGDMLHVVEFRLAHEHYALETRYVREVCPLKDLTRLPGTPPFLLGIVNVRGDLVPVIDLKRFFDLPHQGLTDLHQVIVIEGDGLLVGVLADVTVAVRSVPVNALQPALPTLTGIRADYLKGVTAHRLVVLDGSRIISDPRIVVHQEIEG